MTTDAEGTAAELTARAPLSTAFLHIETVMFNHEIHTKTWKAPGVYVTEKKPGKEERWEGGMKGEREGGRGLWRKEGRGRGNILWYSAEELSRNCYINPVDFNMYYDLGWLTQVAEERGATLVRLTPCTNSTMLHNTQIFTISSTCMIGRHTHL